MNFPKLLTIAHFFLCLWLVGCSPEQQERTARRIDAMTQSGEQLAGAVKDAAETGAALGIPGAGVVALVASLLGTVLGAYNERRRRTNPLKGALTQVVQSVEAAFPERTAEQKSAMASVQDRSTQEMVRNIKGS
jgi:hypothetical protein